MSAMLQPDPCHAEKELLAELDSEFVIKLYRTFQVTSNNIPDTRSLSVTLCYYIPFLLSLFDILFLRLCS